MFVCAPVDCDEFVFREEETVTEYANVQDQDPLRFDENELQGTVNRCKYKEAGDC